MDAQYDPQTSKKSVLIVDDDPSILGIACRAVRKMGFEVCSAGTMLEALNCLTSDERIGLVISDVQMPKGSGLDLFNAMKCDNRWCSIPFALMTGGPLVDLPAGVFVLPKPFRALQICCIVIANLGGPCPAPHRQGDVPVRPHTRLVLDSQSIGGEQFPCRPQSCEVFLGMASW